jgi:hypothetical protein
VDGRNGGMRGTHHQSTSGIHRDPQFAPPLWVTPEPLSIVDLSGKSMAGILQDVPAAHGENQPRAVGCCAAIGRCRKLAPNVRSPHPSLHVARAGRALPADSAGAQLAAALHIASTTMIDVIVPSGIGISISSGDPADWWSSGQLFCLSY